MGDRDGRGLIQEELAMLWLIVLLLVFVLWLLVRGAVGPLDRR
jgi:hypothetical protein